MGSFTIRWWWWPWWWLTIVHDWLDSFSVAHDVYFHLPVSSPHIRLGVAGPYLLSFAVLWTMRALKTQRRRRSWVWRWRPTWLMSNHWLVFFNIGCLHSHWHLKGKIMSTHQRAIALHWGWLRYQSGQQGSLLTRHGLRSNDFRRLSSYLHRVHWPQFRSLHPGACPPMASPVPLSRRRPYAQSCSRYCSNTHSHWPKRFVPDTVHTTLLAQTAIPDTVGSNNSSLPSWAPGKA